MAARGRRRRPGSPVDSRRRGLGGLRGLGAESLGRLGTGIRAAAVSVLPLVLCCSPPAAHGPLVILLSIDTLRADSLSGYGNVRATSPALDRLAADSLVFAKVMAPAPYTIPSHASLMTSLDADVTGVGGTRPLPDAAVTLAEVMRASGYATAAVVNTHYLDEKFGFDQGFDFFLHHPGRKDGPESIAVAEDFLAEHRAEPRFLFLHVFDAHAPYAPPAPYDSLYLSEVTGADGVPAYLRKLGAHDHLKSLDGATSVADLRARYDAGVARVDHFVGEFLERLKQRGEYEEALVIATSDHGEDFYEHRVWVGHGLFLYESELRIPLMVKPPKRLDIAPGRVTAPVSTIDVMPTILDVCDIAAPEGIQGRSLLRFAKPAPGAAPDAPPDGPLFASSPHTGSSYAVRRGRWKYIEPLEIEPRLLFERHLRPDPEVRDDLEGRIVWGAQLYDLARDPGETNNLVDAFPEVAKALAAAARQRRRHNAELRRRLSEAPPAPPVELDDEEKAELRALGYLH